MNGQRVTLCLLLAGAYIAASIALEVQCRGTGLQIQLRMPGQVTTKRRMEQLNALHIDLLMHIGGAARLSSFFCKRLCNHYENMTYGHLYHPPTEERRREEKQDLSKIPGVPGVDYPIYHEVPHTNFHCANVPAVPGMYANVETGCQAYHVCHDGREGHQGAQFLCTNGTIFNQKEFACDWWYNVKCEEATNYYHLNSDPEHNPYFQKKKEPEVEQNDHEGFYIHA